MKVFSYDAGFKILDEPYVRITHDEKDVIEKVKRKAEKCSDKKMSSIITALETSLGIEEESFKKILLYTPFIKYVPSIFEKVGVYHFRKVAGDIRIDKKYNVSVEPKFTLDFYSAEFFVVGSRREVFNLINEMFPIKASSTFFLSAENMTTVSSSKIGYKIEFQSPLISSKKEAILVDYRNKGTINRILEHFKSGGEIYDNLYFMRDYFENFKITSLCSYSPVLSVGRDRVKIDYDNLTDQHFSLVSIAPTILLREKTKEFFKNKNVIDLNSENVDSSLLIDIKELFNSYISVKVEGCVLKFETRTASVVFNYEGVLNNKNKIKKIVGEEALNEILLLIEIK